MNETNSSPPPTDSQPSGLENQPDRDDWSHRRHRLDAMCGLFGLWLSWIIYKDNPDPLNVSVAFYLIVGLVTILGTYIAGAVWDYKSYLDAVKR